jgi:hypothetical protein
VGVPHLRQAHAALGEVHLELAEGDVRAAQLVARAGEALARIVAVRRDVADGVESYQFLTCDW